MMIEDEEERSFLSELFEDYNRNVYETCYKVLKNHHNAEAAVSDTFLRIILQVKLFQSVEKEKLPGLVYVFAKRSALNRYKQLSNRSKKETSSIYYTDDDDEGTPRALIDRSADVEQIVLDNEYIRHVADLIKTLPEDQQTVIALKYHYNFRNDEIAVIMGVNRNNIDSKVHRAKNNLHKLLSDNSTNM
ncbi:MAG: RNA polymerase sigma factor [Clostridia bacterium]|nr:RNA polymerase sigma factor [Clostridia bacterium]